MLIEHIEPITIRLPLTKPMKMAGVTLETADNVLVREAGNTERHKHRMWHNLVPCGCTYNERIDIV